MEAKEEMRRAVEPGRPYRRTDVESPNEVSYIVNRDGKTSWFACWLLKIKDRQEHIFEVKRYEEGFTSRDAAANSLVDQFEEPMRYLRFYKGDNAG